MGGVKRVFFVSPIWSWPPTGPSSQNTGPTEGHIPKFDDFLDDPDAAVTVK